MKSFSRLIASFLLIVLAVTFLMVSFSPVTSVIAQSYEAQGGHTPQGNGRVKAHKGKAVKQHVQKLLAKEPAIKRAMKDFEKRGLKASWDGSASVQEYSEALASIRPVSYLPQQEDTITDGDKEMTFITYDTGDPMNRWEGIIYVRDQYGSDTYVSAVDTPNNEPSTWDVAYEIYYPPDGSNPSCSGNGPCPMMDAPQVKANPRPSVAREKGTVKVSHTTAGRPTPGFWFWVRNWWGCVRFFIAYIDVYYCGGRYICYIIAFPYAALTCAIR
jgi:hypothetical protein